MQQCWSGQMWVRTEDQGEDTFFYMAFRDLGMMLHMSPKFIFKNEFEGLLYKARKS